MVTTNNLVKQLPTVPARIIPGQLLADLNGDGHLDIVAANVEQSNRVFFNDGKGAFTKSIALEMNKLLPTQSQPVILIWMGTWILLSVIPAKKM